MRVWNLDAETFIKHTPDAVDLHKKELWRTFMYEEFTNSGTPASAVGFTQDNYIVYRHVSSDALIAMPANEADEYATDRPNWSDLRSGVAKNIAPAARVKGSIHLLTPGQIISIDNDLENGVVFERKRIKILVPIHQLVTGMSKRPFFQMYVKSEECWIWEAKRNIWEPQIDGGFNFKVADLQQPGSLWINIFYTKDKCPY